MNCNVVVRSDLERLEIKRTLLIVETNDCLLPLNIAIKFVLLQEHVSVMAAEELWQITAALVVFSLIVKHKNSWQSWDTEPYQYRFKDPLIEYEKYDFLAL